MGEGQCNTHYIETQPQHRFGYPGSLAGQTETNPNQAPFANRFAERKAEIKRTGSVAAPPVQGIEVAASDPVILSQPRTTIVKEQYIYSLLDPQNQGGIFYEKDIQLRKD